MYQALRENSPTQGHGFEAVLYCNLAHELLQLGDDHEALRLVDEGLTRCARLNNLRLLSALLVNRVICLTSLGRSTEALPAIHQVLGLPVDASGRGTMSTHFESMAIAALRAQQPELGAELVGLALETAGGQLPDERLELAVAQAELSRERSDLAQALRHLQHASALAADAAPGISPRTRCLYFQTLADVQQQLGDSNQALASLRVWQRLHVERAHLASRARYQAAALQTELLRLRQALVETDARRRSTERARAELEAANEQLSQRVDEVQSLQAALRQQATEDFLTGVFNRRHLNNVLPQMLAQSHSEGQPLALALIDLDHFKAINDRHGHAAGDQLLASFGQMLTRHSRRSDVACRYGGEEFCLLMPRTDALAAQRKLGNLLKQWRQTRFAFETGAVDESTFSAGVVDSLQAPAQADRLLKAADDLLLLAKRRGRNQVAAVEPPSRALA
jgi:diguanylate cyclase (GGDEF)-like protein